MGTEMTPLLLSLPWPPSVNDYWVTVRRQGKVIKFLSDRGTAYRAETVFEAKKAMYKQKCRGFKDMRVAVHIVACPPTRGRRDLDNLFKAPLDALTYAGIWDDDEQIDDLHIVRGPVKKPGHMTVIVSCLTEGQ